MAMQLERSESQSL